MVAKISHGESLYGALTYNHEKVSVGTAQIISGNRIITDTLGIPGNDLHLAMLSFENYLLLNRQTEKPILHISLNPTEKDNLSNEQLAALAKEYMEKMNYGDQPYIVYLHEDTGRRHLHIVSTCVDGEGRKISDSYEWRRSMNACRELEEKFSLEKIADKQKELSDIYLRKVDVSRGDLKLQVGNTLKSLLSDYRFQTFGEWNALLSLFNIEAKTVRGEWGGALYNGMIYTVTDENGKVVSVPFKSSLFGKQFGYQGLEKKMKKHGEDYKNGKWEPSIRSMIAQAMKAARFKEEFTGMLHKARIDVVFRQNEEGRIYGVTFIDHTKHEAYNGSRLGKEFSANVFNSLFEKWKTGGDIAEDIAFGHEYKEPFDDYRESAVEQLSDIFAFDQHGADYEEEAFARQMKRKKKVQKKGRSRDIR